MTRYWGKLLFFELQQLVGFLTGGASGPLGIVGLIAVVVVPIYLLQGIVWVLLYPVVHVVFFVSHSGCFHHLKAALTTSGAWLDTTLHLKQFSTFVAVHVQGAVLLVSGWLQKIHLFGGR
jgi:hypothetical protein